MHLLMQKLGTRLFEGYMGILFNPLTALPASHTGSDHVLRDMFRVYITASENDSQQPIIYNLFRNVS